jgi:hypothetical protein
MKKIFSFIADYAADIDKRILVLSMIFIAVLIYLNYQHGLENRLSRKLPLPFPNFTGHYILFLCAFGFPYLLFYLIQQKNYFAESQFILLLVLAPAIFAVKTSWNVNFNVSDTSAWNSYWNKIIYWPILLLTVSSILFILWKIFNSSESFYGLTVKNFDWKPYFIMLLIMVPLIAAASTQADFLSTYPKMKSITAIADTASRPWWYKLLYEISYGSDFVTIELFFRGFLILGFVQFAGKDAILPMACFYCTIHFGKPMAECISSFFGGILLGIIVYHTKSIVGGLIVHLGIAWLMETGGTIAATLRSGFK